jgi:D-alanyl-D-alanine carboxypeptidase
MLNIILTILIIPFVPLFACGHLVDVVQTKIKSLNRQVLGDYTGANENESCESDQADNYQNYSLFPMDNTTRAEFTPVRKPNYYDIKIWSGSSVAIDVDSGTILEYFNGRKRTQIASLTKLMTAVIVMEDIKNLDEEVKVTGDMVNVQGTIVGCPNSTSGYCNSNRMYVGEKISVRNLLKAMLLNSANDAATALGIYVSGSEKKFVEKMNKKAEDLGLKDTNFCTASGLETNGKESECYSSAYDIARIASYSLQYEKIWEITRIKEDQIYSVDGKYMHQLKNTNPLLSEMPNCLGGKTGFTPMAGKSLLLAAADETKKHRIIAVILDDENRQADMRHLVNWIFENYEWR